MQAALKWRGTRRCAGGGGAGDDPDPSGVYSLHCPTGKWDGGDCALTACELPRDCGERKRSADMICTQEEMDELLPNLFSFSLRSDHGDGDGDGRCHPSCQRAVDSMYAACRAGKCWESARVAQAVQLRFGSTGLDCSLPVDGGNASSPRSNRGAQEEKKKKLAMDQTAADAADGGDDAEAGAAAGEQLLPFGGHGGAWRHTVSHPAPGVAIEVASSSSSELPEPGGGGGHADAGDDNANENGTHNCYEL